MSLSIVNIVKLVNLELNPLAAFFRLDVQGAFADFQFLKSSGNVTIMTLFCRYISYVHTHKSPEAEWRVHLCRLSTPSCR